MFISIIKLKFINKICSMGNISLSNCINFLIEFCLGLNNVIVIHERLNADPYIINIPFWVDTE